MKINISKHKRFVIVFILCVFGSTNFSFASSLEQYLNYQYESNDLTLFAANQGTETFRHTGSGPEGYACGFDMGRAHKYLGYGTVIMAVAAGASGGDNGFHKSAGVGAAVLGVATCGTGFYEYGNYFNANEGFSKHNIHIVLGSLATAGFIAAAASAIGNDDTSHAGVGIGSTALAVIPIIVLKF